MLPSGMGNDSRRARILTQTPGGVAMTEALRAAIAALDETDHGARLPRWSLRLFLQAPPALRRQFEEEMVAPIRAQLEAAQQAIASCAG